MANVRAIMTVVVDSRGAWQLRRARVDTFHFMNRADNTAPIGRHLGGLGGRLDLDCDLNSKPHNKEVSPVRLNMS